MNILFAMTTTELIEKLGWGLAHSIWQIALVALLFAFAMQLMRTATANARYLVGCFALVLMIGLPAVTGWFFPVSKSAASSTPSASVAIEANAHPVDQAIQSKPAPLESANGLIAAHPILEGPKSFGPMSEPKLTEPLTAKRMTFSESIIEYSNQAKSVFPILVGGWLLGVALVLLRPCLGFFAVRRLRTSGVSPIPDSIAKLAAKLAKSDGHSPIGGGGSVRLDHCSGDGWPFETANSAAGKCPYRADAEATGSGVGS